MWVKICGNTNLEDARLAAELGADAVGFVFAPSVRQVSAAEVGRITPHLPGSVERVGVFPAWSAEQILAAVREAGLTTAQLHGGFDLELARALRAEGVRVIQTIHWTVGADAAGQETEAEVRRQLLTLDPTTNRVLIDSKVGAALGGTGVAFDWNRARRVFAENPAAPLILAGGLTPQNIAEAAERLRPWGVDVASGVEREAGRKSPEKMASFIQRAKALGSSFAAS